MNYILKKSRRKTIAILVTDSGELEVRAPVFAAERQILKILEKHKGWIEKQKIKIQNKPKLEKKYFQNGEIFFYLGEKFTLNIVDNSSRVEISGERLCIPNVSFSLRRKMLYNWYAKQTLRIAEEFLENQFRLSDKFPVSLKITGANKQWGSCTRAGAIHFTWRLSMAPLSVIYYVVCHEWAHLTHHNHSGKFWNLVGSKCPDYATSRKWLRKYGYLLTF